MNIGFLTLIELIKERKYPFCKEHKFSQSKFVCMESNCKSRLYPICEKCLVNHDAHHIMEISQLFCNLINEISQGPSDFDPKKISYIELKQLRVQCRILLDTITALYEQIDQVYSKYKKKLQSILSPQQIIYQNIEKSVQGQQWQEQTCEGISKRIVSLLEQCTITRADIIINRETAETKQLNDDIQYFTTFTKKYITQSQKLLEDCVGFASQVNQVHIGIIDINKLVQPTDTGYRVIYSSKDVEQMDLKNENQDKIWVKFLDEKILEALKKFKQPHVLYIDLAGNWNKSDNSVELLHQLLKQYTKSLEVLWLNLSSWKDMSDKQVSYLIFSIIQNTNLKILTLDLAGWKHPSNQLITEESILYISNCIERLQKLQNFSLWLADWENMTNVSLGYLQSSISKLKNLQYLDLSLQNWGNENKQITDLGLISIWGLLELSQLTKVFFQFDRWAYKNPSITQLSIRELINCLYNKKLNKFVLNIKDFQNMEKKELESIRRELIVRCPEDSLITF